MTWTYEYQPAARWGLLNKLLPDAAAWLDAAVIRLAETGRGPLERVDPGDPNTFRLRVKGAKAHLFLDRTAGTFFVTHIYRRT